MKISNRKIEELIELINSLTVLVRAPKASFALAKNLDRLESEYKTFRAEKEKIWRKHFGSVDKVNDGDERIPKYTADIDPVYDEEVEVNIHKFKFDDLNLAENPIAPKVLKGLLILMVEETE